MSTRMIGVISDTHGLLRPEALAALEGVGLILHAGDVGAPEVLAGLERIAPTFAVRGNADRGRWADALPERLAIATPGGDMLLVHDIKSLKPGDVPPGIAVVVSGHSHKPSIDWREGRLHLNPGSAGPRRFRLPVSLAIVDVADGEIEPRLIELEKPSRP